MVDSAENKVLIREFNADTDREVVGKLERNCELGSKRGVSIFTNMMSDPCCRIRFYPLHVMLVAELLENGELVGVVRGCMKHVGTGFGASYEIGSILGLRVSPTHRRMGIGLKLMNSVEEWLLRKGAQYTFLATEKSNIASTNLFTFKCNYVNLSSLVIFVQPICSPIDDLLPQEIKIEKLHIDQAIFLYKNKLRGKDMYPTDIDVILKEKLSLGTWVCYFKEHGWINLNTEENGKDITSKTQSSWVIFSIWNTCEAYKLHIRKSHPLRSFHATLSHAREKILSCLKLPVRVSMQSTFGFLFLYGIHGEGEKLGELMKSVWNFASRLGQNVKDSKLILTELALCDPLIKHVPKDSNMSCINDVWYAKSLISHADEKDELLLKGQLGNVFVDPREF
ncbi:hypothetical protein PRUPE_1G118400 [Prunus persica]|uniref:Uncharacterized protein n=2 Tax=Prunus persica TaxID=3760 RepID=M5XIX5_PRUPE|nr:probable N-acetyltransferase HLS1-like [Prunus persica]ONI28031.1 hypothetical protein PRUPE_1G118400 [Prunus persica]